MQRVLDYLRRNQGRFVEELKEYLRLPSVSAQSVHRGDVAACANWLSQHCRRIGLRAEVCRTPGHPVVLAHTPARSGGRPRVLVYGHYDVQPPDPLDLWKSPPFQPRIQGGRIYGRGTSDNKGQHFVHLKVVEAYLKTGTPLPCDLTFVIEGEEEVGSENLEVVLRHRRRELACRCVVISDTGMPSLRMPALTYALRGLAAAEIRLEGPSRDLHSGLHGGAVENPAMALCQLLGRLRDGDGRIAVPGLYDDVASLTDLERRQLRRVPQPEKEYRRLLGVPLVFGERGFSSTERRTVRPTLEINGLTSGYQGEGSKTIIPAFASAKLTLRLVPNQRPEDILRKLRKQVRRLCPKTVRLDFIGGHLAEPYLVRPNSRLAAAALTALERGFGFPPVLVREGGSIPIVTVFQRVLGAESLLLGLALPEANVHAPNESFHLGAFASGLRMSAYLWPELSAALGQPQPKGRAFRPKSR